jgi:hypothetical protein
MRIRLVAEVIMPRKPRNPRVEATPEIMKLVEICEGEVERRVGKESTFEQRQEARTAFAVELLCKAAEEDQAEGTEVTDAQQRAEPQDRPG